MATEEHEIWAVYKAWQFLKHECAVCLIPIDYTHRMPVHTIAGAVHPECSWVFKYEEQLDDIVEASRYRFDNLRRKE